MDQSSKKFIRSLMLVHNFTPGPVGGAELQAERLAFGLARLGHKIEIITNSLSDIKWYDFGGNIPYAPSKEIRMSNDNNDNASILINRLPFLLAYQFTEGYVETFRYLVKNSRNYDLLHCHMAFGHAVVAVVVSKLLSKKCVIKFACTGDFGEFSVIKGFPGYSKALHILHQADAIVAISREMEKELLEHGFSKDRIFFIPNGVDTDKFKSISRIDTPPEMFRFIHIGRRTPQKGIDLILDAANKLKSLGYENKFEILMYGADYPEYDYRSMASSLGVDDCVLFMQFEKDIVNIYRNAHAVLLPSRYEGLSNVLLEAMSFGLPVVASLVSGTSDVITDGHDGLLVPSESPDSLVNAMIKLMDDHSLAGSLGNNARRRVEKSYSLKNVTKQYSDLYLNLCC